MTQIFPPIKPGIHLLVVIDHHEAKIYRTELHGGQGLGWWPHLAGERGHNVSQPRRRGWIALTSSSPSRDGEVVRPNKPLLRTLGAIAAMLH